MGKPRRRTHPPLLVLVTVRLYAADVEKLKRLAYDSGAAEWQPKLRLLVHEALMRRRVLR